MTDESDAKPAAQVELDAQVKPGAQVKPAAKHKKSNALLNVMIAISAIAMIGALGLIAYPTFSDWWNRMHQSYAVAGYVEQTKDMSGAERKAMLKAAHEYNERLAANGDRIRAYPSLLSVNRPEKLACPWRVANMGGLLHDLQAIVGAEPEFLHEHAYDFRDRRLRFRQGSGGEVQGHLRSVRRGVNKENRQKYDATATGMGGARFRRRFRPGRLDAGRVHIFGLMFGGGVVHGR